MVLPSKSRNRYQSAIRMRINSSNDEGVDQYYREDNIIDTIDK